MRVTTRLSAGTTGSPSSRRAWVEMPVACRISRMIRVALLAEGVGRNVPGDSIA